MHDVQSWFTLHTSDVTGSLLWLIAVIALGVVGLAIVALAVERQRPARRLARARNPETIPTWGDLYLESLAEAHSRSHRQRRGRISIP